MEERTYKACILGASLDTNNRGVSALSHSLIKLILEQRKNAQITLVVSHYKPDIKQVVVSDTTVNITSLNYRLSPRSALNEHLFWIFFLSLVYRICPFRGIRKAFIASNKLLSALYEADFIGDIHGGDSFSDIYGLFRLIIISIMDIVIFNINRKLILLPQTYGPFKSLLARIIAKHIIENSSYILSRDDESIGLIKNFIYPSGETLKKIQFCPDVAFVLDPVKPEEILFTPPITSINDISPLIGLNVSGLLYEGEYTKKYMFNLQFNYSQFVSRLISEILKQTDAVILLVPHAYSHLKNTHNIEDDKNACLKIRERANKEEIKRIYMFSSAYTPGEIKWIIGFCDFFIGSRMHSCIAALSQGIPTVGIAYSKKFKGIFRSVRAADFVIDAQQTDPDTIIKNIFKHYTRKDDYRKRLSDNSKLLKKNIISVFNSIIDS